MPHCTFCSIIAREEPAEIVYETDDVLAFMDALPMTPGHTLLVPTQGPNEAAADTLSQAVFTTVPQGRTFYYRVKQGETLAGIAARYAVSPADLKRWNGLAKDGVAAGQSLRITSDLAPAAGKSRRAAGTSQKPVVAAKAPRKTTAKSVPVKKAAPVAKVGAAAGG